MRPARVEGVNLTLIGAVNAALVRRVRRSYRRDIRKLRWDSTIVEPRTIHRNVVPLVRPRAVHVWCSTTGVLLKPLTCAPTCWATTCFGNGNGIAQPVEDRCQSSKLVGSHSTSNTAISRIRRVALHNRIPNRTATVPVSTVHRHVVRKRRLPISRRTGEAIPI